MPTPSLPAYVPLSLLEAMRNLDTPLEDGLEELSAEVTTKRLGLSETVAAQIDRYREAAEAGDDVGREEVLSVVRLVGRRADAALLFADAGRRAARYAIRFGGAAGRALSRALPGGLGWSAGAKAAAKLARDVFEADLTPDRRAPTAAVPESLTVVATGEGAGCVFYGAAFAELLRGLTGFEGAMFHERCRAEGADRCLWKGAASEGYG